MVRRYGRQTVSGPNDSIRPAVVVALAMGLWSLVLVLSGGLRADAGNVPTSEPVGRITWDVRPAPAAARLSVILTADTGQQR